MPRIIPYSKLSVLPGVAQGILVPGVCFGEVYRVRGIGLVSVLVRISVRPQVLHAGLQVGLESQTDLGALRYGCIVGRATSSGSGLVWMPGSCRWV